MTNTGLAPFPVDEGTLALIEQALDGSSGRSSLSELLDLLSGYDPAKLISLTPDISEYPDPIYHYNDVIRALVAEVRRLRDG